MRSEKWRQTWRLLSFESRALYATVPTPKKRLVLGSLDVIIVMNFDFEWSSCGLAVARLITEPRLETASIFLRRVMTSIVKTELKLTTLTGWRAWLISNVHAATRWRHSNALSGGCYKKNCRVYRSVFNFLSGELSSPGASLLAPRLVRSTILSDAPIWGYSTNNRTGIHGFHW